MNTLQAIQQELSVPKNQRNEFGNYKYRSCEDILEAVKPLLKKHNSTLIITDGLEECGGWVFVKATAALTDGEGATWLSEAFAKHPEVQKGMSDSQITGAASSYARKYALNGLFAIDDTKDADSMDNNNQEVKQKSTALRVQTPQKTAGVPNTAYCPVHNVQTFKKERNGKTWYSHQHEGEWCNVDPSTTRKYEEEIN